VLGALLEHHVHALGVAIDRHAPAAGEIDRRALAVAQVGEEDAVPPDARRRHFAHVQHHVAEIGEEHARFHFTFRPAGGDVERDLAKALVGVGDADDEDVGGGGPRRDGDQSDRTQQPQQADAARLQRHELAIGRQPAERHQQRQQQRHGQRQRERLRDEAHHQRRHDLGRDALGDERLRVIHHHGNNEDECEDEQPEQKWREDLPDHVAVDDGQHAG
jgi:hypothetical protein